MPKCKLFLMEWHLSKVKEWIHIECLWWCKDSGSHFVDFLDFLWRYLFKQRYFVVSNGRHLVGWKGASHHKNLVQHITIMSSHKKKRTIRRGKSTRKRCCSCSSRRGCYGIIAKEGIKCLDFFCNCMIINTCSCFNTVTCRMQIQPMK